MAVVYVFSRYFQKTIAVHCSGRHATLFLTVPSSLFAQDWVLAQERCSHQEAQHREAQAMWASKTPDALHPHTYFLIWPLWATACCSAWAHFWDYWFFSFKSELLKQRPSNSNFAIKVLQWCRMLEDKGGVPESPHGELGWPPKNHFQEAFSCWLQGNNKMNKRYGTFGWVWDFLPYSLFTLTPGLEGSKQSSHYSRVWFYTQKILKSVETKRKKS